MRFDGETAKERAGRFPASRLPWTADGRRAAREAARAFAEAGYEVELASVFGSASGRNARIAVSWLGFGLLFTAGAAVSGVARGVAGVLFLLGLTWLGLAPGVVGRVTGARRRPVRATSVLARRPGTGDAPVRVVFLTTIDAPPPAPAGRARRRAGQALALLTLALCLLALTGRLREPTAALAPVAAFDAAVVVWLLARVRPFVGEDDPDGRDGLGTLVEMAASWPRATDRKLEVVFAAVGGQHLDAAGIRALPAQIRGPGDRTPTLVVGLWRPGGHGGAALLAGTEELEALAGRAAADLWLDRPVVRSRTLRADHWPVAGDPEDADSLGFVGLVGLAGGDRSLQGVEPRALAAAAQLATEVALRWAKSQADQPGGESRDRSSQKPG